MIAGGFVLGEVLALPAVEMKVIGLLIISALIVMAVKGQSGGRWMMLLLFCCLIGLIRMSYERSLSYPRWEQEESVRLGGRVISISRKKDYWQLIIDRLKFEQAEPPDKSFQAILIIKNEALIDDDQIAIKIGMKIAAFGETRLFDQARNPGEFDLRKYYRASGIIYRMTVHSCHVSNADYLPVQHQIYRIKEYGINHLKRYCSERDLGIFSAAILGDKSWLDGEVKELYQNNGISHLLAISGLHISMIGMGIYQALRKIGMNFPAAGLAGAVLMVGYGVLTGGSPSVVRAVVMFCCSVSAAAIGRTYDLLSALSLAALLLLWQHPLLLLQAGFQLSFLAVFAIAIAGRWMIEQLDIKRAWMKTITASLAIQLITLPIILFHYYQYPVYSMVLNLIVVPMMGFILISGITSIALGTVSAAVSVLALGAGHYVITFYDWICRLFERLPSAVLVVGQPKLWQISSYYAILLVLYGLYRSGRLSVIEKRKWSLLVLLGMLFLKQPAVSGLQVTFLDVGQGDGFVLQTSQHTMLFDGGSSSVKELGKKRLEPYLKAKGISVIDYAFVSHGDQDHISGLCYLLEEGREISVKHLILPYHGSYDEAYHQLAETAKRSGSEIWWLRAGDSIQAGDLVIESLYPPPQAVIAERNDHSPLLLVSYNQFKMLLTGDMGSGREAEALADQQIIDKITHIDLLKVAHHGSKNSNSEQWVTVTAPTWAVISYGAANSYGHPHQEVRSRFKDQGTAVWETARQGAVTLSTDGRKIKWSNYVK